jgi:ABC-type antimicrobial peptide transport system permease subunit
MQLVVRAVSSPAAIADGVRAVLARLDPDLPASRLQPMTDFLSGAMADTKIALSLLGSFALMAVALAAAGIYGVMAYAVAQRRVEFGIRMALGASRADVLRLVGATGLRLTGVGIAVGLAGGFLATSLLRDMIVGVNATDPRIFGATAVTLAAVAMTACLAPAFRAMRVEPSEALRSR